MPGFRPWLAVTALIASVANAAPFLGQHVFYLPSYDAIEVGAFDGIRIWGNAGTTWRDIEPERGRFDFTRMDAHVAAALARKMDVMYTLGQTPAWASKRPLEVGNMGAGASAPPKDMRDWIDYVTQVAQRYRGRISAYEVMNEPRVPETIYAVSPGFYSGDTVQLVEMTRLTQSVVAQVSPGAKVVCPVMDGETGPARLQYFLARGGGKYCDIIGFHFYLPRQTVADYQNLLARVRVVMKQNKVDNKPLWATEIGMLVLQSGYNVQPREPSGPLSIVYTDIDAARRMVKLILVSILGNVARTYWFAHDSSSMGSTQPNKTQGKLNALGMAYRTLRYWLKSGTLGACSVSDARGDCSLMRSQVLVARIVWGISYTRASLAANQVRRLALLNGSTVDVSTLASDSAPATLSHEFQDPMMLVY